MLQRPNQKQSQGGAAATALPDMSDLVQIKPAHLGALVQALERKQFEHIAVHRARLERIGGPLPEHERLPLMEDGHEFGRVEARMTKAAYFQLMNQKNFGYEGLTSDEGMRDILKAFPQFRVKTVSGKIVSGWRGPARTTVKRYG